MGSLTLQTINKINSSQTALESLEKYETTTKSYCLNSVQMLFWRDWPLSSDLSTFLTSKPLHHWHKQFWDHNVKWCTYMLGGPEIDFCFSVLHNRTSYRHFNEGVSWLKQVTGQELQFPHIFSLPSKLCLISVTSPSHLRSMKRYAITSVVPFCCSINTSKQSWMPALVEEKKV